MTSCKGTSHSSSLPLGPLPSPLTSRDRHRMIRSIQDRPGEIVETGIDQVKHVVVLPLDSPNFGNQIAALGHEVAARFDFQPHGMAEFRFQPLAGGIAQGKVGGEIDVRIAFPIDRRQTAADADRSKRRPDRLGRFLQRAANLGQMFHIGARADVNVQAGHGKPIFFRQFDAIGNLRMPNAVLRLLSAGVRFLAVSVAETRIDPQRDAHAGQASAELLDHVHRAAIDVQTIFDAKIERFAVENIGRIDDRRRIARDFIAGRQGTADFVRADRIDQYALAANQFQNGQVRACLLRIADFIERRQIGNSLPNRGGIIDKGRRAEFFRQVLNGYARNLGAKGRMWNWSKHEKCNEKTTCALLDDEGYFPQNQGIADLFAIAQPIVS